MSLLDEAKLEAGPRRSCKMAEEIQTKFSKTEIIEFVELMQSKEVGVGNKHAVLTKHGIVMSESILRRKLAKGCPCVWCQTTWMSDVSA